MVTPSRVAPRQRGGRLAPPRVRPAEDETSDAAGRRVRGRRGFICS